MENDIYYFGCKDHRTPGHYLHNADMRDVRLRETPWGVKIDGGLCRKQETRNHGRHDKTRPDGETFVARLDGWTAVAFWDRSGDDRGNSNSAFIVHAEVCEVELLDRARLVFPRIFERIGFPVLRIGGNVAGENVGAPVHYHPLIGGKHDGKLYELTGIEWAASGDQVCWLKGKSGYVAVEAVSFANPPTRP